MMTNMTMNILIGSLVLVAVVAAALILILPMLGEERKLARRVDAVLADAQGPSRDGKQAEKDSAGVLLAASTPPGATALKLQQADVTCLRTASIWSADLSRCWSSAPPSRSCG